MWSLYALSHGFHVLWLCTPIDSSLEWHALNIRDRVRAHITHLREYGKVDKIQTYHLIAYHSIMTQTYDDNLLDDGSSALKAILQFTPVVGEKASAQSMMELVAYLFTPAASRRSAMTAA
jgi:hypothetical protein